jgi:hypothetical protein
VCTVRDLFCFAGKIIGGVVLVNEREVGFTFTCRGRVAGSSTTLLRTPRDIHVLLNVLGRKHHKKMKESKSNSNITFFVRHSD